jgi:proteic killer suppression protein
MNTPEKYRDSDTASFAAGQYVKRFASIPRPRANIALDRLDAATGLVDLLNPPGNRFEKLRGDREGQYSIRINDRWRVCFEWPDGDPEPSNIEIVDYHR